MSMAVTPLLAAVPPATAPYPWRCPMIYRIFHSWKHWPSPSGGAVAAAHRPAALPRGSDPTESKTGTLQSAGRSDARLRASHARSGHDRTACQNAKPWHLYVQVRIIGTSSAVVAAHAIVVGSVLKATDLRVEQHDISELPPASWMTPRSRWTDRQPADLRRRIPDQSAIGGRQGRATRPIGDLGRRLRGMSVRMAGRALSDGLINQRVRVQNLSSGKTVEGLRALNRLWK